MTEHDGSAGGNACFDACPTRKILERDKQDHLAYANKQAALARVYEMRMATMADILKLRGMYETMRVSDGNARVVRELLKERDPHTLATLLKEVRRVLHNVDKLQEELTNTANTIAGFIKERNLTKDDFDEDDFAKSY